jgi:hypothetical protein
VLALELALDLGDLWKQMELRSAFSNQLSQSAGRTVPTD